MHALQNQTMDSESYEVIVVDDGSKDGTADVASQYGARVWYQDHAGAAAARNLGARHARGDLLLFTDADCEPFPDWIEQMAKPFSDPQVAGVKGTYRTRQQALIARFSQAEFEEKYAYMRAQETIDFIDTYSAAYRRQAFLKHGGFDPTFLLDEDQEFSFRLSRAGYHLLFAPEARVHHNHPATAWRYTRRKVGIGRWKVRVHLRHPRKAIRDSYTPWTQKAQLLLLPTLLAAVATASTGWVPWLVVHSLLLAGLISALPLMIHSARQGWLVFLVSPALIALRAMALDAGLLWGLYELTRPTDSG